MATHYNEIKIRQLQYLNTRLHDRVQPSLAVQQYNSKVDTLTLATQQHIDTVKFTT